MDKDTLLDKENIHKELDLIQGVINRMASNSFLIKGWMISLLAVVLALTKDSLLQPNWLLSVGLGLAVLLFWYLDAFFLFTEKKYRALYEWAIKYRLPDYNYTKYLFDLRKFKRPKEDAAKEEDIFTDFSSPFGVMFTQTIWPFYIVPLALLLAQFLFSKPASPEPNCKEQASTCVCAPHHKACHRDTSVAYPTHCHKTPAKDTTTH